MDIAHLLSDKTTKAIQKREHIVYAIERHQISITALRACATDDKSTGVILEAMESVSKHAPSVADIEWLHYAIEHISSKSNTVKREASRVVGNIAHLFPDHIANAVEKLMANTGNPGTVVRWATAYALGQIVRMPRYANSELFDAVDTLAKCETETGVKNQYLSGLKKGVKIRKSADCCV